MKIGIDISPIIYGTGVSVYTRLLVKNLLETDSQNQYIFFGGNLRRLGEIKEFTNNLKGKFETKLYPLPPTVADIIFNRLHFVPIEAFIGKVDVFHSSDWTQPPSRLFKVTTVHDLVPFKYPKESHKRIISAHKAKMRWIKREVDKVIAVSQATKKDLIKMGVDKTKIEVVYEAHERVYDAERIKKVPSLKKRLKIKDKYLIAVGVGGRKNTDRIIKAFRQLELPGFQLVFIGRGEVTHDDFCDVIFTGHINEADYETIYYGAAALVYAPLYEGFGLPILEAFESRIPVVASNTSSMPEVAGDAAVMVDPENIDSIAWGIKRALKLKNDLVRQGVKQVKKFSWKKTAEQTLKIYSEAASPD